MNGPLSKKRVLLLVGGGIAAYKAPLIVRALIAEGAEVRCVLTPSATEFVAPLALQAVSHNRVGVELFDPAFEEQIGHIELARWPDVILIAPATANLMARMAAGLATDLATTILLATRAPVVLAPAMNTQMLAHPATQRNLQTLASFGHTLVTPDSGALACQEVGAGRQPDPEVLVDALTRRLLPKPLRGRRVLVTAGPTRAFLDPVRFLSNPSTGRMGVALARAAAMLGAEVTLVHGPLGAGVPPGPEGTERVGVETTPEMAEAVLSRFDALDMLIMAAAVGDWTPREVHAAKRKKSDDSEIWTVDFQRTTDILAAAGARRAERGAGPALIGFAAETHDLEVHARAKLERKQVDAILGNWVRSEHGDTFGSDLASIHAVGRGGWSQPFGPGTKEAVSFEVITALGQRFLDGEPT